MIGRRKKASPLPSRVYEKNGAWYFVDIKRKWHKLCRVSDGLTRLYTELAAMNRDHEARDDEMMAGLVDAWLMAKLPTYARTTQENYRVMAATIKAEFIEYRVDEVQPMNVARFLDLKFSKTPSLSNKYRALLSVIMAYGVRKGLRNDNPVREVGGASEKKRDRYITDGELAAVKEAACFDDRDPPRPLPSARAFSALIDLAYLTAQRIGDLLALNWADVSDEGISFRPAKTVNSSGVRLLIAMNSDLRDALDLAKGGKVVSIGPVISLAGGSRMTYKSAHKIWTRACERARRKYERDCAKEGNPADPRWLMDMHFHDLRAKALTDKTRAEGAAAAQALAGHTTAAMTAHYTKAREVETVTPLTLKRSS
ncbi:tyrosine-type recombinase/integrase [Cupriavidus taiwanensis]|uniref:tyrosine-type recombinase/integrase n=1 Tax=Cupriavidus taiwanensis TaxID=164546 RepID=UPI001573ABFD|nr:tyrosine-type recombinase/integrase [Cupriavidus taiwanensis]NSX15014.1 tyrosine-type recombinase/integrase [Cupriavidus taiwanensis]